MSKKKKVLIIAGIVLVILVGGIVGVNLYVDSMLGEMNHVDVPQVEYTEPVAATEAQDDTQTEPSEAATEATEETKPAAKGEYVNYLVVFKPQWENNKKITKTVILCTLNTADKTVTMTPMTGKAYVKVPAFKDLPAAEMTLDAVYGKGGMYGTASAMALMNQTLYSNFGIEVDYNFEIDFSLLANVVHWLGGVEMNLSEAEAKYLSQKTGVELQAGPKVFNSSMTTAYIRMWDAEEETGANGIGGQKKLLDAILSKAKGESVTKLEGVVRNMMPMLTTSMTEYEIKECMLRLLPMLRDLSIQKGEACPANGKLETVQDKNGKDMEVIVFDSAEATKLTRAITEGEQ